jgi:uncharacterized peroxidase-related enzyme
LAAFPDTAGALMGLAQAVLRGPSPLTAAEREFLATAVSAANGCTFCAESHGAAARTLLGPRAPWVDAVLAGRRPEDLPSRLGALTNLAVLTARSGHAPVAGDFAQAREAGASDREIHDAVLVASAFSLFNRYVTALGAPEPEPSAYGSLGDRLARAGYA